MNCLKEKWSEKERMKQKAQKKEAKNLTLASSNFGHNNSHSHRLQSINDDGTVEGRP